MSLEVIWLIVGLVGALVGALLPADNDEMMFGFLPQRIFNTIFSSLFFCFWLFIIAPPTDLLIWLGLINFR